MLTTVSIEMVDGPHTSKHCESYDDQNEYCGISLAVFLAVRGAVHQDFEAAKILGDALAALIETWDDHTEEWGHIYDAIRDALDETPKSAAVKSKNERCVLFSDGDVYWAMLSDKECTPVYLSLCEGWRSSSVKPLNIADYRLKYSKEKEVSPLKRDELLREWPLPAEFFEGGAE
ncbi:MAG: hypothetical protein FWD61_09460 [Phycisphaerales bacterium]|nr:hypothetical protein [Phycisphaerales bacterium]